MISRVLKRHAGRHAAGSSNFKDFAGDRSLAQDIPLHTDPGSDLGFQQCPFRDSKPPSSSITSSNSDHEIEHPVERAKRVESSFRHTNFYRETKSNIPEREEPTPRI